MLVYYFYYHYHMSLILNPCSRFACINYVVVSSIMHLISLANNEIYYCHKQKSFCIFTALFTKFGTKNSCYYQSFFVKLEHIFNSRIYEKKCIILLVCGLLFCAWVIIKMEFGHSDIIVLWF